jgi:hypothetical protein
MAMFHMATPPAKKSFEMACYSSGFSGFDRMFPIPLTTEALIGIFIFNVLILVSAGICRPMTGLLF